MANIDVDDDAKAPDAEVGQPSRPPTQRSKWRSSWKDSPNTTPSDSTRKVSIPQQMLNTFSNPYLSERQKDPTESYVEAHTYWPPPMFIFTMSLVQIAIFVYYASTTPGEDLTTFCYGCHKFNSWMEVILGDYVFDPASRAQVWRYLSSAFLHSGLIALLGNVFVQLIIGIPLEAVHKGWCIGSLYCLSIIFGNMLRYVISPAHWAVGASGAVYGLFGALIANLVINWREVPDKWCRVVVLGVMVVVQILTTFVYPKLAGQSCVENKEAGHFGGLITGLLYGVFVLHNVLEHRWEKILRRVCLGIYAVLFLILAVLNFVIKANSAPIWEADCHQEVVTENIDATDAPAENSTLALR